ncbi:DGCR6L isoform X2 [Brachionus plicatilis]|uniref:DGCR6L isoform X2 n=1 Tax=Brachionus plicatilis TaxID=10195 RepID=A0A3M7PFI7_BRAPC|nr:DGCR6L isoform X2 [Brachionus plicatilis]
MSGQSENKQLLQKRHYFILEQLQLLASEAPPALKHRLSTDFLSTLAVSLLDGTVFEIVNHLVEMQQISERNFFNERSRINNDYLNQRNQLLKRHKTTEKACEIRPHHLNIVQSANKRELDAFDKRMNDELHRLDVKIVQDFDNKVLEQQETMNQAGVPYFFVTQNPNDLKMQMYVLKMIQKLSGMKMPE